MQNPLNYTDCTGSSVASSFQCCFVNSTQLLQVSSKDVGVTFSEYAYKNLPNYCIIYDSNSISNGEKSWTSLNSFFGTDEANLLDHLHSQYGDALKCNSSFIKLSLILAFLLLAILI